MSEPAGGVPPQADAAAMGDAEGPEKIEGTVERILFCNEETGYAVVGLRLPEGRREATLVGNLATLQPQEYLRVTGEWVVDRKYGRQFRVATFQPVLPTAADAMEKFLASGLIRGIGKTYAKRLVAKFGADVFDVIENHPERLLRAEGIGPKRMELIRQSWQEHRALREIIMFVQQYGIPQGFAHRIYRQYGAEAIAQIRRNPYQLALDIKGIGFKSADMIAQKIGIPLESVERCKAGVFYIMQELAGDGHMFFPADPLIQQAEQTLGVEQGLVVEAVNALKAEGHLALDVLSDGTRAVYLASLHRHEVGVAASLRVLLSTGKLLPKIDPIAEIAKFEQTHLLTLAPNQREAVAQALRGGVLVITGGPGTGKTTIIKAVLVILQSFGVNTLLAAPTGRAAKRMNELTGMPASTIHRLLQFSPQENKWLRNPQNPLRTDYVIIDEASMIDVPLAHALLRAVPSTTSLVFVGDVDQLPSVGPGSYLRDLIDSGVVPMVRLREIFRQAQESHIIMNAHRVNSGNIPVIPQASGDARPDFVMVERDDPAGAVETIKELIQSRIPRQFGMDPRADIQVITPMHRGLLGAQNLNRELQALLNAKGASIERGSTIFRTGDKVMQTANDYDKDVFNGDIGFIMSVNAEEYTLRVSFDGRPVHYEAADLDNLELAYAITVHKSQGSEYRAVVMPVHTTHFVMLQRNLLYTAITRGRGLVVLVGQKRAMAMAVENYTSTSRHSGLARRLAAGTTART